jgi:hypothetical protein
MEFPLSENSCKVEKNFIGAGMINKAMFKQVQAFRRQGYSKGSDERQALFPSNDNYFSRFRERTFL